MNWEMVGAIGEIVGAAAVVVSLLYVARQLRESGRQARLTSMQALYGQLQAVGALTASDPQVARIFVEGLEGGMASLDKHEAVQFGQLNIHVFKAYEEAFQYMKEGIIEESRLRGFERSLLGVVTQRGWQEWWASYRPLFDPEFQVYLDGQIEGLDPALDFQGWTDEFGLGQQVEEPE